MRAHLHARNCLAMRRFSAASVSSREAIFESTQRSLARAHSSFVIDHLSDASCGGRLLVRPLRGRLPLNGADRVGRPPEAVGLRLVQQTAMGVASTMDRTFQPVDWQPQASTGNRSQVEMPFLAAVPALQTLPAVALDAVSFNGCLIEAARHSGLEDQEIADAIHICHGYMSRFMRGVAQQWAKRLVAFMRVTRSLAPLQWMAREMGCELVVRDLQAERIARLQAELRELQRGAA